MDKVVSKGTKIDLHIHSVYSKNKDKDKVANNTLENLPVLTQKLIDNEIELCAITDHDEFNYEIYKKLKCEETEENCIKKVLPGIEFSVEFVEGKVIHIVTIFDDRDDTKVKNIEQIMKNGIGKTAYRKNKGAYPKNDYFEILNEINIDFVMIAHQKKTVSSQHKAHANDVMVLGKDTFNELVFLDYFDAYEFTYMAHFKQRYSKKITDEQAVYSDFVESKNEAIQDICKLIEKKESVEKYEPNVKTVVIEPECNPVDKYKFISKVQIEKIGQEYIEEILKNVLKRGKVLDTESVTERELKEFIKNYPSDDESVSPLGVLKMKINSKLDKDFKIGNTIIEETMDVFEEVSSGFDAQMYFTLICGETRDKGIYLIDQPEDHISQKAIKEKVLDQFRNMGQNRQVIMVTHNPQFIVNLDVDNVIFLCKENGRLEIKSGALEYENDEYSILKIVADNIDGGLQTILGRMKRYEKNIEL